MGTQRLTISALVGLLLAVMVTTAARIRVRPRSTILTGLVTLTLLLAAATPSLAAPADAPSPNGQPPEGVTEMCLVGKGVNGRPTAPPQCLLYLPPNGANRPDFKRLQVIGTSVGPDGVLLDRPQVVDATDRNVVVAGKGRTKDGKTEEVNVRPADFTVAYVNCDLILYEHDNNGGDSVCFNGPGDWDLAWVFTWGSPFGWHDQASSYESQTRYWTIVLCVDPLTGGYWCNADLMHIPWVYPYALNWIDAWGGSPNWPYTWNDAISGVSIY